MGDILCRKRISTVKRCFYLSAHFHYRLALEHALTLFERDEIIIIIIITMEAAVAAPLSVPMSPSFGVGVVVVAWSM